ncbi:2,5-dihydroxypyridine 5,6-dioxygenase [Acinetobacter boissieri]|uniref:2,5-dihydroxypyridine 5,6-dioxygenase n=1 Tax=Acinetobacter boissieri TaxID=1219383 RepID=A0A1G6JQA8_9GAMM|nr:2,5-dihydroxypyridine 5,6-dioxygenase [Acinetobacter boissieri]SDC20883.1 2,5-dihydroxypyridine 5,6-dioxygenase [Acinetobacter boissieri]
MPINDYELSKNFEEVLRLSKVDKNQTVAILSSHYSNERTIKAAMNAVLSLGAKVFVLELPAFNHPMAMGNDMTAYCGDTSLTGNIAAQRALETADLIIDTMMLLHSPEQEKILKTGTRILLAVEPPEVLARMLPTIEDKVRVKNAESILKTAKQMHVTSDAGTDFYAPLGQYPAVTEYGFADEPGRWDHWPSGFLFTWPNENQAEGILTIDVGDILLPFKMYVRDKITLEINKGMITNIHGGFEAEYLRDYMSYFNDPEVYGISHIGWGLQPRAQWTAMGLHDKNDGMCMDARAFDGNFLFSTGPNTEVGGSRKTPCHMDIPLRNCTIKLDDKIMVNKGKTIK